jgi:hypothetical protein
MRGDRLNHGIQRVAKIMMKVRSIRSHRKLTTLAAVLVAAGGVVWSGAVFAQREGHRGPGWRGDIARFHEHDWGIWRGGHWLHQVHGGRTGWWWVVGDAWYFYPSPVYPYPSPWEPPPAAIVSPPVGAAPPTPPTPYWYLCEASKTYYPYTATCPGGWKQVPAVPGDAASSTSK